MTETCRDCPGDEESRPLVGIGPDGLCLVCRDKRHRERVDALWDRLERWLESEDGDETDGVETRQASLGEVSA